MLLQRTLGFLVGVLCLFLANVAGAQDSNTLREAREHHQTALDALESGDLQAAERGFRAAMNLAPRASSAFNLALVLIDGSQFVEAIVLLRGLERGRYGDVPVPAEEVQAHRLLAEEGVAILHVETEHPDPIELRINEQDAGTLTAQRGLRLRLDPGMYELSGASVRIEAVQVELAPGQRTRRTVVVLNDAPKSRRGLILGLVLGSVVVAAVVTGVVLALRGGEDAGGLPVVFALHSR